MDNELELAQLEYMEARLSEIRPSLQELENALGIALKQDSAEALMRTIVERLSGVGRGVGNLRLAEEFRETWRAFLNAVSVLMRAMMANDDAESERAMQRADDAEEQFERVIAEAVTWLKATGGA